MPSNFQSFRLRQQTATSFQDDGKPSELTNLLATHAGTVRSSCTRRRLLTSFLKIGMTGFGGGMAVISLMEAEFVSRLGVVPADEFVTGVGLSQILGAFPVNTAVFIGYRQFGVSGALLSVAAFLLPSVLLVTSLSFLYFRFHTLPALDKTIAGLGPVVIALILSATWSIGRKLQRSWLSIAIGSCAFGAGLLQISPVWILLASAAAGYAFQSVPVAIQDTSQEATAPKRSKLNSLALVPPLWGKVGSVALTFLKIGAVFFGGGFVLVPLLRDRIVSQLNWLTPKEFLDGLAISTLTPGPIAVIATFVGYHHAGIPGALIGTVALFMPGIFLMVWISHEYVRFRDSQQLKRLMSGLNPGTVGLILSAALLLGRHTLGSWPDLALLVLSSVLLVWLRWHPAFVLAIGAAAGYLGVLG